MYSFEFTIQALPPTTNSHGRVHWSIKAKIAKTWKESVRLSIGRNKPAKPLTKAKITLTRHSSQPPDADGLVSSFKHVLDGLKFASVIIDDKLSVIGMPEYKWERAPIKKGFITVKIEEQHEENIHNDSVQVSRE